MSKTIAIANQRATVGKTTVAVNLAAALAVAEYRVLLVEGDPASEVAITIDQRQKGDLLQVIKEELTIGQAIVASSLSGLDVLPASYNMWQFDLAMLFVKNRQSLLSRQLAKVSDLYDYIIIDCPSSLGLMTVNALLSSDQVIVPVADCRQGDLDQLVETITTLNSLRMADNKLALLANKTDRLDLTINQYSATLLTTTIPLTNDLAVAGVVGVPVILHRADCLGSKVYLELAQEVINNTELRS